MPYRGRIKPLLVLESAIPVQSKAAARARARENRVAQDELIEAITHLAFCAGWTNAVTIESHVRPGKDRIYSGQIRPD